MTGTRDAAFVHREAHFLFKSELLLEPEDAQDLITVDLAGLEGFHAGVQPSFSSGAYQHFTDRTQADWPRAYYGQNRPRLIEIKRSRDPDNLLTTPKAPLKRVEAEDSANTASNPGCMMPFNDFLVRPSPLSQRRGTQMRDVTRLIVVLGGLVAAMHLLARGVTAAQPVATPSTGIFPPPTDDATAIRLEPTMAFVIVLMLLLLALIVVALLFRYLRESRQDYYETIREFGRKGVYFNPVLVNSTAAAGEVEAPNGAQVESATFELAGPGIVAPGQEARFAALRNGVAADSTTWALTFADGTAVPTDRATLNRSGGPSVTLTAAKPGIYVLAATDPGSPALTVRSTVTVETLPACGTLPDLPFIGQGYGSIVGAVVIVAALVALAATRAIDADVVGVILGALTGYLFGVGFTRNRD